MSTKSQALMVLLYAVLVISVGIVVLYLSLQAFTIKKESYPFKQADYKPIYTLYKKLWAQTGESEKYVPLIIHDDNSTDNAYADGFSVHIYTGLINKSYSMDEIALVLGHEIAHTTLGHVYLPDETSKNVNAVTHMEAQADKMGAVYAMKAGYSVCKGRNIMLRWFQETGDLLGSDHPNYSYRYAQLNYGCE